MEGTDFEFDKWDRVRLRDTVDPSFYGNFGCSGNEGWIADRRVDARFGLPEVYIKWDKNHWTYNGAPDRWTFQEHFELVNEEELDMSDTNDQPQKKNEQSEQFKQFQAFLKSRGGGTGGKAPQRPQEPRSTPNVDKAYSQATDEVHELLNACEGFVVIGVTRRDHPEAEKGVLIPVAMTYAKNPESALLATSSASKYASEAHQQLVIETIAALSEKDE